MNLKFEKQTKIDNVDLGDVVVLNGNPYIVMRFKDEYVAKPFDGRGGATGIYSTIEDLRDSLKEHKVEVFSKDDYELVLQRKS